MPRSPAFKRVYARALSRRRSERLVVRAVNAHHASLDAEQLTEIRRLASVLGVKAVAPALRARRRGSPRRRPERARGGARPPVARGSPPGWTRLHGDALARLLCACAKVRHLLVARCAAPSLRHLRPVTTEQDGPIPDEPRLRWGFRQAAAEGVTAHARERWRSDREPTAAGVDRTPPDAPPGDPTPVVVDLVRVVSLRCEGRAWAAAGR
jgi:hypothetical protein